VPIKRLCFGFRSQRAAGEADAGNKRALKVLTDSMLSVATLDPSRRSNPDAPKTYELELSKQ
jgi:hypothetical protein